MADIVRIGKRIIPFSEIALVEHFDPAQNPKVTSDKPFAARVVLLDRDSVLTDESVESFAGKAGLRVLAKDRAAVNPRVHYRVETFTPSEGFQPQKPYAARLLWKDQNGRDQSKLMVSSVDSLIAVAVEHGADPAARQAATARAAAPRGKAPKAEKA